jgi:hypothetical protein
VVIITDQLLETKSVLFRRWLLTQKLVQMSPQRTLQDDPPAARIVDPARLIIHGNNEVRPHVENLFHCLFIKQNDAMTGDRRRSDGECEQCDGARDQGFLME